MTIADPSGGKNDNVAGSQRLDKWLWHARVVKTRTLATKLVAGGNVRVNRTPTAKPSHALKLGDVLTISVHARVRILSVRGFMDRRGSAECAALLFADLTPPFVTTEAAPGAAQRVAGSGRPTKRDRRLTDRFNRPGD